MHPAAVDVAGGVECAPGVKDVGLVRAFIDAVRGAQDLVGAGCLGGAIGRDIGEFDGKKSDKPISKIHAARIVAPRSGSGLRVFAGSIIRGKVQQCVP